MLVLASQSTTRLNMLQGAGLAVEALPARIDEQSVKEALKAEDASTARAAETLAELKAQKIAAQLPRGDAPVYVIGCDQMLAVKPGGTSGEIWFDKPPDRDHARAQLTALSGKTHELVSSVVVLKDGERIWHHTDAAKLEMRILSPDFIDTYLETAGDEVLQSVGCYHLEGYGAQLFNRVEGDFFTVLGLPLLPLLGILRTHGVLQT